MNPTGLGGIQSQLPLGQTSKQPDRYDPSVLVSVPRTLARGVEGIDASRFYGHDCWNCWEMSWLNEQGRPSMRVGQLVVPANSPNLCESKSLKLYFNSFANEAIASEALLVNRICDDLEAVLGLRPELILLALDDPRLVVEAPKGLCSSMTDLMTKTLLGKPLNIIGIHLDKKLFLFLTMQTGTE